MKNLCTISQNRNVDFTSRKNTYLIFEASLFYLGDPFTTTSNTGVAKADQGLLLTFKSPGDLTIEIFLMMSKFPKGVNIISTRKWLDMEGFRDVLVGWEAQSILGLDKSEMIRLLGEDEGLRLWNLLSTARQDRMQSDQAGTCYFLLIDKKDYFYNDR